MPDHGGNLAAAAVSWKIPLEDWLDLSTGINPFPWQVADLPESAWQRLPGDTDELTAAARRYYGCEYALPVPGSQAAISWLPHLRAPSRVGIVSPTYSEHARHWRLAGHDVRLLSPSAIHAEVSELDVLVMVRPNNPDGLCLPGLQVLQWWQTLQERGGWLVVDEAFADVLPRQSLADQAHRPGLVVLRSFGKFFGLPGLRLGFVIAQAKILKSLEEAIGPWAVSGPAFYIGCKALEDTRWQAQTRKRLAASAIRLRVLLQRYGIVSVAGTDLFAYFAHPAASWIADELARRGILVRRFAHGRRPALRLGLPGPDGDWCRLDRALVEIRKEESRHGQPS